MKRIVVTGASSGIGRLVSLKLSSHSVELVLVARREQLVKDLAQQCEANGSSCLPIACDVTDYVDCMRMLERAKAFNSESEVTPVLVNSAGVAEFGDFAEMSITSIENQIRTNLMGPLYACHEMIPWMIERGGGQIINVLSMTAAHVMAGSAAYSAAKAGLLMLGKTIAAEYRRKGVRVTSVLPGATDTPIWNDKSFVPPREDMLTIDAVADLIADIVLMPPDRNIDELTIMPPKGVL